MAKNRKGIGGFLCACSTYLIIALVSYSVYYLHITGIPSSNVLLYLFFLIVGLSVWSHLQACLNDPGYIPLNYLRLNPAKLPKHVYKYFQKELQKKSFTELWTHELAAIAYPRMNTDKKGNNNINNNKIMKLTRQITRECCECESIKPPLAHHCNVCGRCIAQMDHHCPWINNCVGLYTKKPFFLFLIYTFIGCSMALLMMAMDVIKMLSRILDGHQAIQSLPFSIFLSIVCWIYNGSFLGAYVCVYLLGLYSGHD